MVDLLPAVLVGGPPHAGKSVLTYNLSQELRKRRVAHYVLRANPDGEGDWTQEAPLDTIRQLPITKLSGKDGWTDNFIMLASRDLERRPLPLLVDLGGLPTDKESSIFCACTHSLLLLRSDKEANALHWQSMVKKYGLTPFAELYSVQNETGISHLVESIPIITGTLANLERQIPIQGKVFTELVDQLSTLFSSYTESELKALHFGMAPKGVAPNDMIAIIDFSEWLDRLAPGEHEWKPALLPRLLDELPHQKQLALYGRGPNWLYAMAAAASTLPLYQFDAHISWIISPSLHIANEIPDKPLNVELHFSGDLSVLEMTLTRSYLDYLEADDLRFPAVPTDKGLIISGRVPHWLYTGLVRLYQGMDVPWIACFQPPIGAAVVVASKTTLHPIGEIVPMP